MTDPKSNPKPLRHGSPGADPQAPWSPVVIAIITMLFSFLPGGILHALNYARLGRPDRTTPNLVTTALAFLSLYLFMLFAQLPVLLWALVINLAYAAHFYKSQHRMYESHRAQGGNKGPLLLPAAVSLLSMALVLAVAFGYDRLQCAAFNKACAFMDDGRYQDAEPLLKRFKAYEPEEEATYYNLALVYSATGRDELALDELRHLLKRNPKDEAARVLMRDITGSQEKRQPASLTES